MLIYLHNSVWWRKKVDLSSESPSKSGFAFFKTTLSLEIRPIFQHSLQTYNLHTQSSTHIKITQSGFKPAALSTVTELYLNCNVSYIMLSMNWQISIYYTLLFIIYVNFQLDVYFYLLCGLSMQYGSLRRLSLNQHTRSRSK